MFDNIKGSGGATVAGLTERQSNLATRLLRRHGRIRVARERSGLHFYMPSPIALRKDGRVELYKMHLAINIDKYENGIEVCGQCMKYDQVYSMDSLLTYPSLAQRNINNVPEYITGNAEEVEELPELPGDIISIVDLSKSDPKHPCINYLKLRKFHDFEKIQRHVDASYCSRTNDNILLKGYHRTGFINEPAGRIVLFTDENGQRLGWQGRILEFNESDITYYWFYKNQEWVAVKKHLFGGEEEFIPPYEGLTVSKYYFPKYSRPSTHLMGYDAAIKFNEGKSFKWIGIAEGPFDIMRVGPPFCAAMGKHFNDVRAKLIANGGFDIVFVVCDDDSKSRNKGAGEMLWRDINKHVQLAYNIPTVRINLPKGVKDLGETDERVAKTIINKSLNDCGVGKESLLK